MIKLENISKVFETEYKQLTVFKNLNLEIPDNSFQVIFGHSGAGKTTLLNIIGGMDRPTTGRVLIDGVDIYSLKPNEMARLRKERIGFIFQTFNLLPNLSALDNITLPAALDIDLKNKQETACQFAEGIGIGPRLSHKPQALSAGEQQRVAVTRAMINSPSIILADEPTADLDEENAKKIIEILTNLQKKNQRTVIFATNDALIAKLFPQRFDLI
ncbi:MAG: ABC transporter ATP-binding protein [Candidatus Omnitrophica bacterium]|nr:ABC transporter ATP-binding protein [Candidatus Omnitrophota bacterium]